MAASVMAREKDWMWKKTGLEVAGLQQLVSTGDFRPHSVAASVFSLYDLTHWLFRHKVGPFLSLTDVSSHISHPGRGSEQCRH